MMQAQKAAETLGSYVDELEKKLQDVQEGLQIAKQQQQQVRHLGKTMVSSRLPLLFFLSFRCTLSRSPSRSQ